MLERASSLHRLWLKFITAFNRLCSLSSTFLCRAFAVSHRGRTLWLPLGLIHSLGDKKLWLPCAAVWRFFVFFVFMKSTTLQMLSGCCAPSYSWKKKTIVSHITSYSKEYNLINTTAKPKTLSHSAPETLFYLSVCLPTYLPICLSVYLPTYPPTHPSVYLPTYRFMST